MRGCRSNREKHTHLVVGNANSRHRIRICPQIVLHELDPLLLHVLAAVTKGFPTLLPLHHRILESASEVGVVALVRLDSLLSALELQVHLLQVAALYERALRGVRIDPHTVRFVLLACPSDVAFLGLLVLEFLLDRGLDPAFVLLLLLEECSRRSLEVILDCLRNDKVGLCLLFRLLFEGIQGCAKFSKIDAQRNVTTPESNERTLFRLSPM